MASKKKNKADRATAIPTEKLVSKKNKIAGGRKQISAILNSPEITVASDVKQKATDWSLLIDAWEANGKQILATRTLLATLEANEPAFARRWDTRKRATFSAVTDYADGSIDTVNGFGCGVLGHHVLAPASAPTNLKDGDSSTKGTAYAVWDTVHGRYDFEVQHATDPATPSTYSDPVSTSRASFKLAGQARGATLYFRVLTLDPKLPGGKSDWTPWVAVVVG
jgi:hypothetical protein